MGGFCGGGVNLTNQQKADDVMGSTNRLVAWRLVKL